MNNYEESIIEFLELEMLKRSEDIKVSGELDLTALEEEIQDELDIPEEIWEEEDYSFFVYTFLVKEGYLND